MRGHGGDAVYDRRDQYDKIHEGLMPGEVIHAVFDAIGTGTGFIGLTDRRAVLQNTSFVGGRTALTSVPYRSIHSVSYLADRSVLGRFVESSSIALHVGGEVHEVKFRGADKARHAHEIILAHLL